MGARPVIGVPADRRQYGLHPFHMVGEKYLRALFDAADALPLVVPVLADAIDNEELLNGLDGLFLTGSPSDIEPHHYGGESSREGTLHDPERDALTLPVALAALDMDVPLFAVCRGFQELNVALGGSLHQRVHEVPGYHNHKEDPDDPLDVQYGPAHPVQLVDGGWLASWHGATRATVNSLHGQGIRRLADGLVVEALADDGLIEAYRVESATFALAVQWHPEWQVLNDALSTSLFKAFGDACRAFADK